MKNIHRDPSYVPLKSFKEGLQRCPPKLPCLNRKKRENHAFKEASKFAWNTQKRKEKKKECKRWKTSPKSAWNKTKVWKKFPQTAALNEKKWKYFPKNYWKSARNFFLKWGKTAHPNPKSARALIVFRKKGQTNPLLYLWADIPTFWIPSPILGTLWVTDFRGLKWAWLYRSLK